jgi:hypothetical protein
MTARARPRERRTVQINARLTPADAALLRERAARAGLKPGGLAAALIVGRAPSLRVVPPINAAAWTELAPLSSNINQLAYHANSGAMPRAAEVLEALNATRALLVDVRAGLLGRLDADADADADDGDADDGEYDNLE